jgi:hypothetical protein
VAYSLLHLTCLPYRIERRASSTPWGTPVGNKGVRCFRSSCCSSMSSCPVVSRLTMSLPSYLPSRGAWSSYDRFDCPKSQQSSYQSTKSAKARVGRPRGSLSQMQQSGIVDWMLARRLTTILPAMTLPDALDTTRIHRVADLTGTRTACVITRADHPWGGHKKAGSERGWNPSKPSMMQGQHPTANTQGPAIGTFLSRDALEAQRGHGLLHVTVSGIKRKGEGSSGV